MLVLLVGVRVMRRKGVVCVDIYRHVQCKWMGLQSLGFFDVCSAFGSPATSLLCEIVNFEQESQMTRHQRFDMMYTVQVTALLLTLVRADPPWARDGDSDSDDYGGGRGWRGGSGSGGGRNSDSGNGRYFGNEANGFGFGDMASFTRANRILIAHAVVASLVWVVLVPFGGLVLRVGLRSPAV